MIAEIGVWEYAVFGGVLRSELALPELPEVPANHSADADWSVRVEDAEPPALDAVFLGERQLGLEGYRLSRTPRGMRLEYSHAGTFDVSADGSCIVWYRRADAQPELARSIVLGSAIAIALELEGMLCLHGSAVAIGKKAVAFVGPKHYGKSTLATALAAAGAQLLGDDLLAVVPGLPVRVRRGVPSVRLWDDAARTLSVESLFGRVIPGVKTTAAAPINGTALPSELTLAAVYELHPERRNESGTTAWRTRLSRVAGAVVLAQQTKLPDSLIGLHAAGRRLQLAAHIAGSVPVWRLHAMRDLARLPELVQQIVTWHQESAE